MLVYYLNSPLATAEILACHVGGLPCKPFGLFGLWLLAYMYHASLAIFEAPQ
jgi:hypothetical protein